MAEILTVKCTRFAYGGETMGRLEDGRVVFVPFALPGETARVLPVEEKRGYVRADLVDIVEPASERCESRCAHFGICGGCHYQQLPYASQLDAKVTILADLLERIGKIQQPQILTAQACPTPFYYRNHVQFHLSPEGRLGYHQQRTENVLPIQECHLPEQPLNWLWPQLDFEALPELDRIGLRLGAGEEFQLILESKDPQPPELSVEDLPVSVVHLSKAGSLVLAGSETLEMEVLGRSFQVSAGSFFQVNTLMAERMVEHLLNTIPVYQPLGNDSLLMDVYCGVGLFSAFLAPQVGELIGVEASTSATEDFMVNLDEFDHVRLFESTAEEALPYLVGDKPQVVLVDPPRSGIGRGALDSIVAMQPSLLVYVSCDPSTLARDARRLVEHGYHLEQVTPFDLFPQTYHIESISFWTRQVSG